MNLIVQIILTALFYVGQFAALVVLWMIYQQNKQSMLIMGKALAETALKSAETARVLAVLLEEKVKEVDHLRASSTGIGGKGEDEP